MYNNILYTFMKKKIGIRIYFRNKEILLLF